MALTRSALREKGIAEKEILDYIMEEHGNTIEATKEKAKEIADQTAEKLQATIDALQGKIDNAPNPDGEDWKVKHDTLKVKYDTDIAAKQKEYDDFKISIETKEAITAKQSILRKQLETDGVNPKLIGLLEKEFDPAKIELDGESIKDWNNISKSVKEQYADVFTPNAAQQKDPASLPVLSTGTGKQSLSPEIVYTKEQIKQMTPAQINENWDKGVKQALEKGK